MKGAKVLDQKLGFLSSAAAAFSTVIFAFAMLIGNANLSYGICMILSWSFILMACSYAVKATQDRKAVALGGVARLVCLLFSYRSAFCYLFSKDSRIVWTITSSKSLTIND
jgi:hypothetical protein